MKEMTVTIWLLMLMLSSTETFSQEKEKPVVELSTEAFTEVEDAFQEHFFEALKQKAIENHDRAIEELLQCLQLDPDQAVVYLELGKNLNAMKEYSQAATYLEKGRNAAPENTDILEELYEAYFLDKDYQKALPVVQELVEKKGSFAEDLINLLMIDEQYSKALSVLDSLEEIRGTSKYREDLRREIYSRNGDTSSQVQDLKSRIEADPKNEMNYLNLIFVYSENGNEEKAFQTAQELLEVKPDSELVHLALYKFYIAKNLPELAVQSMHILLKSKYIDEVTKYQALNDFLLYVQQDKTLEDELVALVETFSRSESNNKIFAQLGDFFLEKGDAVLALEYYRKALSQGEPDYAVYFQVIELLMKTEEYEQVVDLGNQAIEIFPTQSALYLAQGKALNQLQRFQEAEESLLIGLDFVIENPPMQLDFLFELTQVYTGMGQAEKAKEMERQAAAIKTTLNEQNN